MYLADLRESFIQNEQIQIYKKLCIYFMNFL